MKKLKEEKGSISLFVIVSMLFFVLFLTGVYMLSSLGQQRGISETAKIKEIYEKDINQIDDVYETLMMNIVLPPVIMIENENTWTKDGKNITIEENKYLTKYTLDGTMPSQTNGYTYTGTFLVDKNCTITVAYLNNNNEVISYTSKTVTKIDKIDPMVLDIQLTPSKTSIQVKIIDARDGEETEESGKSGIVGYRYKRDELEWTNWTTDTTYTFEEIYGDLAGQNCTIHVQTKDLAGRTKEVIKTETTTCLNSAYYRSGKINLCSINGRTYTKCDVGGAIAAGCYYLVGSDTRTSIAIVSPVASGVKYTTSYNNSIVNAWGTIDYHGTTYYYSGRGYEWYGVYSITSSLKTLNSANSKYASMERAVVDLLNKYFGNS